jgi:hypothetical protein
MRTTAIKLRSEGEAVALTTWLVLDSQYFSVEPLPDGEWELRVKDEHVDHINKALAFLRKENTV